MMVKLENFDPWHSAELESFYKLAIQASGMKMGDLTLAFRIMLVGGKFGPHLLDIAAQLGREETESRMRTSSGENTSERQSLMHISDPDISWKQKHTQETQ